MKAVDCIPIPQTPYPLFSSILSPPPQKKRRRKIALSWPSPGYTFVDVYCISPGFSLIFSFIFKKRKIKWRTFNNTYNQQLKFIWLIKGRHTYKKVFFLLVGPLRVYPPYTNGLVVPNLFFFKFCRLEMVQNG